MPVSAQYKLKQYHQETYLGIDIKEHQLATLKTVLVLVETNVTIGRNIEDRDELLQLPNEKPRT